MTLYTPWRTGPSFCPAGQNRCSPAAVHIFACWCLSSPLGETPETLFFFFSCKSASKRQCFHNVPVNFLLCHNSCEHNIFSDRYRGHRALWRHDCFALSFTSVSRRIFRLHVEEKIEKQACKLLKSQNWWTVNKDSLITLMPHGH